MKRSSSTSLFIFFCIFNPKGNFMKLQKLTQFLLAMSVTLGGGHTLAAGKHDHSASLGGIMVESKERDYEIVAKPEVLQIYLSDHGKPAKVEGAKAKVTLLNGSDKTEVQLLPAGNKLEAKGSFKVSKGTKGVAMVTVGDKTSTVRFEIK
jgi:hypothetical protein